MGEGRAPQDPQSVPRHAQLQHIQDPGSAVESHVQCGETAVLRGAVEALQTAYGETP